MERRDYYDDLSHKADLIVKKFKSEKEYASMETIMFSVLIKLDIWHPDVCKDMLKRMGVNE